MKQAKIIGQLIIEQKWCNDCKQYKAIKEFYITRKRKDGLGLIYQPTCIECERARSRKYRTERLKVEPNYDVVRNKIRRKRIQPWYDKLYRASTEMFHRCYNLLNNDEIALLCIQRLRKIEKRELLGKDEVKKIFDIIYDINNRPQRKMNLDIIKQLFTIKLQ